MSKNKRIKYGKQHWKNMNKFRLERIKREIVTEIYEDALPGINFAEGMNDDNIWTQRGRKGKWIDGTPMTPEKMGLLGKVMSELVHPSLTTSEQRDRFQQRIQDLNQINRELNDNKPLPKIIVDIDHSNDDMP
jgi:hypothetical protein